MTVDRSSPVAYSILLYFCSSPPSDPLLPTLSFLPSPTDPLLPTYSFCSSLSVPLHLSMTAATSTATALLGVGRQCAHRADPGFICGAYEPVHTRSESQPALRPHPTCHRCPQEAQMGVSKEGG
ncbi:unnamed protein product [Closterium sp. NIES-54]